LCIAVAYYFLFLPLNVVVDGVTGITIIFSKIFSEELISSSLLIFVLKMVFLGISYIFLGKEFFIKTLFGSIFLPLIIGLFEVLQLPPDYLFTIDNSVLNVTITVNDINISQEDVKNIKTIVQDFVDYDPEIGFITKVMIKTQSVVSGETKTLTLGETNLAKLTAAEKKIATDKGWVLA
jgi:hypothetical protein